MKQEARKLGFGSIFGSSFWLFLYIHAAPWRSPLIGCVAVFLLMLLKYYIQSTVGASSKGESSFNKSVSHHRLSSPTHPEKTFWHFCGRERGAASLLCVSSDAAAGHSSHTEFQWGTTDVTFWLLRNLDAEQLSETPCVPIKDKKNQRTPDKVWIKGKGFLRSPTMTAPGYSISI